MSVITSAIDMGLKSLRPVSLLLVCLRSLRVYRYIIFWYKLSNNSLCSGFPL